ncbi:Glutamate--cysteine ligase regulatory subunit [Eufriesea mexicana]|uniref:GCS light chain n=1 Tax=Eufriesea mexicana TaxID=516756 RepID=A0A310S775_9HYME|nr:Glutamate--cysteine ligase regulatory subunit [Eufriesea mexicana]
MLSQNILVRTGNILSLNEAKTKASQNPTDELIETLKIVLRDNEGTDENPVIIQGIEDNALKDINREDVKITVKVFISSADVNLLKEAIDQEELLASLKHLWTGVEEYVKIGKLSSVGLSDVDTNVFIDLLQWANIKPNIVQISLATCCVVPPVLQTFAKENDVQLLTHNDPGQILHQEDLNGIFNAHTSLYWITRYQIHLKCRGILSSKGYLVNRKWAAYISTEKDECQGNANIRINEEMENEHLDKFHTRLHFCRRDLICTANAGKDDNGSQFFFTLGSTSELQCKHTIFGKVTGETMYNMLKFEEAPADENDEAEVYKEKTEVRMKAVRRGSDLTGTGEGGKSIYEEPFKDEFHTRLHFCRRGSIAMAEMTMIPNSTLLLVLHQNCRINIESLNDRPLYPPRFIKTIILNNPFSDIIPRIIVLESEEVKNSSKTKTTGVKDLKLLLFGEEESVILNKKFSGKGKSAYDHLTDPKLNL